MEWPVDWTEERPVEWMVKRPVDRMVKRPVKGTVEQTVARRVARRRVAHPDVAQREQPDDAALPLVALHIVRLPAVQHVHQWHL